MNELRIHTQVHSRYQLFDVSGKLPFSIVFGLCRRSPADTDPRPLLLETAGSVLDVSYGLAHGLLTLHEKDAKQGVEVDLSRLSKMAARETECISLPSPVNRTEPWRDAFTIHQCHVDVNGDLASILKPGKTYIMRLASKDLGVKRWAYSARRQFSDHNWKPIHDSEALKFVNSKPTAGKATFTVVKNLSWPPRIETRIRLRASSASSDTKLANAKQSSSTVLEVTVINTGSDSVSVQTRGHQRFLIPWGPFQPESKPDARMRIIDAMPPKPPMSSLQVVNSATGQVVRGNKQRGTCQLTTSEIDRRPKADGVVILKPGAPVSRKIDIGALVDRLVDGQYKIRMRSTGCRWWHGEVGKEAAEDGRVPAHLGGIVIPPLMLESQDELELHIRDGEVDQSM